MTPGSNFVWEVTPDGYVNAYWNDQQIQILGCLNLDECKVEYVIPILEEKTAASPEVACGNS